MFLIDTNVISEARKGERADGGVREFFNSVERKGSGVFLSAITIGELRRGAALIRHRGDAAQANRLDQWLSAVLERYADKVLPFDHEIAQVWGRLRVPHHENAIDKQIAATALVYDLTLVTRNTSDFTGTGAKLLNPFSA
jgi:predicted nucleic acid-binding protein